MGPSRQERTFLVDTGASRTSVCEPVRGASEGKGLRVVGISGATQTARLLQKVQLSWEGIEVEADVLYLPDSGINLLGRDLLDVFGIQLWNGRKAERMCALTEVDEQEIADKVWAEKGGASRMQISPIQVQVKPGVTGLCTPQYPMSRKGREGLKPVIERLLEQGMLEPTMSPFNSPILAVAKKDGKYRLVQDLRNINKVIVPRFPTVPDPYTILGMIPTEHRWFTVIDLKDAFWSCPLDEDSRPLFAFEWTDPETGKKGQLRWTVLPQGYTESPLLFGQALSEKLQEFDKGPGITLVQYVDDLLLSGKKREEVRQGSIRLLNWLSNQGLKVSKEKLQFVEQKVKYLGHYLQHGTRSLDPERIRGIMELQPPRNKTEVRKALGMIGYCRLWLDQYAVLAKFLHQKLEGPGDQVEWVETDSQKWETLKEALTSAPVLALPNSKLPFHLYVSVAQGVAIGVLAQKRGGKYQPVAYLSKELEPVVKGWPVCVQAVAAAAVLVIGSKKLTFGGALIVHSPHQVNPVLSQLATTWMTEGRLLKYETILRTSPDVVIGTDRNLNPAEFLSGERKEWEPEDHDCLSLVEMLTKVREDLEETPLEEGEKWFIDGSSRVEEGKRKSGYAIVDGVGEVIEKGALSPTWSAQKCELYALARALELAEGIRATIWTDSKFAWGVVHTFGKIWQERGYIKANGKEVEHVQLVDRTLEALKLPDKVAIVHVAAHQKGDTPEIVGNRWADKWAKEAAGELTLAMVMIPVIETPKEKWEPTEKEKNLLEKEGCVNTEKGWKTSQGVEVISAVDMRGILEKLHEGSHWGTEALVNAVKDQYWSLGMWTIAHSICWKCLVCLKVNKKAARKKEAGGRPLATWPFQRMQIDFTELPEKGGFKYLLVMKDQLTGWVEALPTRRATAGVVTKILLEQIIPRYGMIEAIDSDRGTHFTQRVLQQVMDTLKITWDFHTPWHPESSGKVERANGELKKHLTKLQLENGLPWTKNLPLALLRIRTCPRKDTGVSPFEMLMGRPYLAKLGNPIPEFRDLFLRKYLQVLSKSLFDLHKQGLLAQRPPLSGSQHKYSPGDWVLTKTWRTEKLQPSWEGPYQVLLTTESAVRTREGGWTHYSRVKAAPNPEQPWRAIPVEGQPLHLTLKRGTSQIPNIGTLGY